MKKLIGLVVIVLIGIVTIYVAASSVNSPTEAIRIGAILGLTGEAAEDSLNVQRGLELAKEDLAKRGVLVEISYQDDKTDPKQAILAIQYLLATEHPQALVGPIWSFLEDAAGPTIATNKIVAYAPADTSEFVSHRSLYNFRGAPLNALKAQPLTEWIKTNHITKVAIIVSKDAWGASNTAPFRAAAQAAGAEVVVDETLMPFSSDAANKTATILTKAKAAKAEAILWTGYEPDAVALVKKKAELGITAPVIAATSVYSQLLSGGVLHAGDLTGVYELVVPASVEFVEKFTAKYGEAPGSYADRAYDGLLVLVDAIQHAPAKDSDSIAKYMRTQLHYTGAGGVYKFNENGDVKGGEWVIQPVVR